MRPALLAALCIVTGAGAARGSHRDRARQAETLGQMSEAAAEYEAAWSEERAPELLYRLGLARRRLREYARAKQAFRGYLSAAPDGPLQGEVERQIAQLNVLIDAQAEDAPARGEGKRRAKAGAPPLPPRAQTPAAPAAPQAGGAGSETSAVSLLGDTIAVTCTNTVVDAQNLRKCAQPPMGCQLG